MATRPKAVIESRDGEELSPITITKNVLTDDGQNLHDILSDRKEDMMTPTIENSSSMFKVGQGDNVDYSENVVDGAYESLVFKGKSLVNLWKKHDTHNQGNFTLYEDGFMETVPNVLYFDHIQKANVGMIKPNTKYLLIVEVVKNTLPVPISFQSDNRTYFYGNSGMMFRAGETGVVKKIITSISDLSTTRDDLRWGAYIQFSQGNVSESERGVVKIRQMLIEYQQGMENWDIPYFEGICDCKSPILLNCGKNISPINTYETTVWEYAQGYQGFDRVLAKNIVVDENKTYTLTFDKECESGLPSHLGNLYIMFSNSPAPSNYTGHNAIYTHCQNNSGKRYAHITMPNIGAGSNYIGKKVTLTNIQLRESSTLATYEPYKSNTVTFNQKDNKTIVLRSLPNGVCDTLNVETGEYVQRIGEAVFDGSNDENWKIITEANNWTNGMKNILTFNHPKPSNCALTWSKAGNELAYLSNKFPSVQSVDKYAKEDKEKLMFDQVDIKMAILKSKLNTQDLVGFKAWLSQNPVTVQYELATPIVSTVDIQGFPHAYKDGHVQLSSGHSGQSLTPKVEYSVVTNRNGQIRSNQKMVERHQKQLDHLQAMVLTNLVNTQYEQALTNLKYDLKNVREEVK